MVRNKNDLPKGIGSVSMKVHRSPKSRSQLSRWENARLKKSLWEKYNPKSEFNLKDFAKRNNVLDNNIEIYDMSVQVNYSSKQGGLLIKSQTFKVIAFKGLETRNNLDTNIKTAYENMIFTDTGDTFNPSFQSAISRNTQIDTNEIRGLEKSENIKLSKDDYISLNTGNYVIRDLNPKISASKNKKNGGGNDSTFNVELDLSQLM